MTQKVMGKSYNHLYYSYFLQECGIELPWLIHNNIRHSLLCETHCLEKERKKKQQSGKRKRTLQQKLQVSKALKGIESKPGIPKIKIPSVKISSKIHKNISALLRNNYDQLYSSLIHSVSQFQNQGTINLKVKSKFTGRREIIKGKTYEVWDCGGGGDCFFKAVSHSLSQITINFPHVVLRHAVGYWFHNNSAEAHLIFAGGPEMMIPHEPHRQHVETPEGRKGPVAWKEFLKNKPWSFWGECLLRPGFWAGGPELLAINKVLADDMNRADTSIALWLPHILKWETCGFITDKVNKIFHFLGWECHDYFPKHIEFSAYFIKNNQN